MISIDVVATSREDSPPWPDIAEKVDHHVTSPLRVCVLEGGMASGQPSIGIAVQLTADSWVVAETSLVAFLAAAQTARAMAETRFGWEMPA